MNHSLLGLVVVVLLSPFSLLHAQTPCGNIIAPETYYDATSNLVSTPIANCTNPFDETSTDHTKYRLSIDGQIIVHNGTIEVPEGGTSNYQFVGSSGNGFLIPFFRVFRHSDADYRFVNTDEPEITEADYRVLAQEHFGAGVDIEEYVQAAIIRDDDNYTDEFKITLYDYLDYVDAHFVPVLPKLRAGTYTLETREDLLILSNRGFFRNLLEKIIPTAYAQEYVPEVFTFTFTITEHPPEPEGASSVLFLPGIQASRLYTDGILGTENQIWEPNINADVEKLEMTESGESVNSVYTRDVIDELAIPTAGTNVYKGFLSFLEDLKEDKKIIKEYQSFAYDWRFDVIDIAEQGTQYEGEIKNLVTEIEKLASTSYSHKVTIIGHSNGGLLGKALITELERQGKSGLVDKLVMIGTPQLGTPKAIGVMLHGYDQLAALGQVVDDDTARDVIRNMPGAYGLLPSAEYFEKAHETLVSADTSNTTASVRAYGAIETQQSMNNFLLDTQNMRNDAVPIYEPSTLNSQLLQQSFVTKRSLDAWVPPAGVSVYEVVGTGNPTIKAFEYQSYPCAVGIVAQCLTGTYMKASPIFTDDGDETVMALSASGQDGVKVTGYVDLFGETPNILVKPKKHFNMTESTAVQSFVDSIIKYPYLAQALVVPAYTHISRTYKVIGIHSPVSLVVNDATGKQVGIVDGKTKEDIVGSQYLDLGGSKYIIIPDDISFTAKIKGEATGVYSLTVDKLSNGSQTHVHRYIGANTNPAMLASFTFANNTFSNIATDLNGDGTTDIAQNLDGQIIPPPVAYSYPLLKTNIKALRLKKLLEVVLLAQADAALYWDTLLPKKPAYQKLEFLALDTLKATLQLYKQKKFITQEQYVLLEVGINNLRN